MLLMLAGLPVQLVVRVGSAQCDPQFSAGCRSRLTDKDVNIAPERGQPPEQTPSECSRKSLP